MTVLAIARSVRPLLVVESLVVVLYMSLDL